MSVNHRLLSDFCTDHGEALDQLFTQVIASLVDKDVVKVSRISQDGVRVRVGAGASSFRREAALGEAAGGGEAARGGVASAVGFSGSPARGGDGETGGSAQAGGAGEAGTVAAGDRAVTGTEAAAGGSGEARRAGRVRRKDSGERAAGEHDGCGSAADEDAERGIQPGGERAVGDATRRAGRLWGWRSATKVRTRQG